MEQKQYWNEVSATKEFTIPLMDELFSQHVKKDDLIIDVGCGYGRVLNELYGKGYRNLVGFDFSEGMISRGLKQFPYLDLRVMKDGVIDLRDDAADAVVLIAVLTCIYKDEDQEKLISEIRRVLKPDGILYIGDYLLNDDERNKERYEKYAPIYGPYGVFELPEGAICRHHSAEYIESLLKDFQKLEFFPTAYVTMNGHSSKGFCYLGRKD